MIKVGINGCNGRMGQVLDDVIQENDSIKTIVGISRTDNSVYKDYPIYSCLSEVKEYIDVLIDFSHPDRLGELLNYCVTNKVPLVLATTGFSSEQREAIKLASREIPILNSGNMSLGINILISAVKEMAKGLYQDFDIEIIEKHHNKKVDAPSGTAYMIADGINETLGNTKKYVFGREGREEKREKNEIGIHAIRGGTIVGEHSVIFAGLDEIIEIKHTALSKKVFAIGAMNGARFIINKENGLYTMDDLFNWMKFTNNE